jgi:hypothetical protein
MIFIEPLTVVIFREQPKGRPVAPFCVLLTFPKPKPLVPSDRPCVYHITLAVSARAQAKPPREQCSREGRKDWPVGLVADAG